MNETIQELSKELTVLVDQVTKYLNKPTKAESKRIRNGLNQLKKDITLYKKTLIELDKAD